MKIQTQHPVPVSKTPGKYRNRHPSIHTPHPHAQIHRRRCYDCRILRMRRQRVHRSPVSDQIPHQRPARAINHPNHRTFPSDRQHRRPRLGNSPKTRSFHPTLHPFRVLLLHGAPLARVQLLPRILRLKRRPQRRHPALLALVHVAPPSSDARERPLEPVRRALTPRGVGEFTKLGAVHVRASDDITQDCRRGVRIDPRAPRSGRRRSIDRVRGCVGDGRDVRHVCRP